MLRLKEIRRLSQKHATRIPVAAQEPDYSCKGAKTPEELTANSAFLFKKASTLAFSGYLLRATHVFGFAEGLLWAAGALSIDELRKLRSGVKNGHRSGFRGLVRRSCYRIGDWFYEFADRI